MSMVIDRNTYMIALAHFCMARSYEEKVMRAEKAMHDALGIDAKHGSHLSDAIYDYQSNGDFHGEFNEALARQDIVLADQD